MNTKQPGHLCPGCLVLLGQLVGLYLHDLTLVLGDAFG
jgi:hypothetical protein